MIASGDEKNAMQMAWSPFQSAVSEIFTKAFQLKGL